MDASMRLSPLVLKIRDRLHVICPDNQVKDTSGLEMLTRTRLSRLDRRFDDCDGEQVYSTVLFLIALSFFTVTRALMLVARSFNALISNVVAVGGLALAADYQLVAGTLEVPYLQGLSSGSVSGPLPLGTHDPQSSVSKTVF
jgi:hypothetical protein